MGFPLAYVLARTRTRYKNILIMLVVLPLFVGNAVRAAGWMVAFGNKGVINASLMGAGAISTPLEIMFTETAVIIGITAVNLPFMVLTLQSVIEGIDRSVEEAAFNLGATPLQMARRVLLPLAMPGVLAGTILTFILAMNAYATPVLLGGPALPDDGAAGLRPVRAAEQLAVRRRDRVHPDDRDTAADARRQLDGAAALPGGRGLAVRDRLEETRPARSGLS